MPTDPRKRQKKLERRKADRKAKRQQIARATPTGLGDQIRLATRYPLLDCFISDVLWEEGIGTVTLSRELPNGMVAFAIFLVDRYCLGVKDAFLRVEGAFSYRQRMAKMRSQYSAPAVEPACARKLVEEAVRYAESLGLHPHPDYAKARLIFGDIDPAACTQTFEFGKDGKPFFINGPNDTPARCRQIIETLARTCGQDNFHYLMQVSPDTELALVDEDMDYLDEDEGDE